MMSKNSIVPFLKDYLIKFLTRPFLLDTNGLYYVIFPVYKDKNQNCIYYRFYVEPYKRAVERLILKNEMFEANIVFIIYTGLTPIYFDA